MPLLPRRTLAAALLAAAAVLAPTASALAAPIRVAVMDFKNNSGDDGLNPLGKGLRSMLTTDLSQVSDFEVVERERLAEIQAELKLGQSELVDPKTAVKVGKLISAKYLVIGSFQVSGEKMRIDGQLVAVEKGTHVATAEATGEKDAFFELEKQLVKKLVAGAGVKLKPKERASIAKIHTADYEAFKKFSDGLAYFDAERYDKAMSALREATAIDAGFDLARVTLAEYTQLIDKTKAKAQNARTAEVELWKLERDKKTAWGAKLLGRLFAIAAPDSKSSEIDRHVAMHLIASLYKSGYRDGPLQPMRQSGDQYAFDRTAETYMKTYYAGARKLYPKLSPIITGNLYAPPPKDMKGFKKYFAKAREAAMKQASGFAKNLDNYYGGIGDELHLDTRERAMMYEGLYKLAKKHAKVDREWDAKVKFVLGGLYRDVLDLDRSTRWYAKASSTAKDAKFLEKVAKELETNKELAAFLASVPKKHRAAARELLILNHASTHSVKRIQKLFDKGDVDKNLAHALEDRREHWCGWRGAKYCIVGDQPAWAVRGDYPMGTGPRDGFLRTDSMYYYVKNPAHAKAPSLVTYGAEPRTTFSLSLDLHYDQTKTWWAGASDYDKKSWKKLGDQQKAQVSLVFGLTNIETREVNDRRNNVKLPKKPMQGWAVRLKDGSAELVAFEEGKDDRRRTVMVDKTLKRWKIPSGKKLHVSLNVGKSRVTLKVNGRKFTANNPANHGGYVAFEFAGPGYARVEELKLK